VKSQNWAGSIGCVYAGDANGEGTIEIVTAGSFRNDTGSYSHLRIWQWKDEALVVTVVLMDTGFILLSKKWR